VLVVAEVGLALVLTIIAGLLVRSMERLLAVDPGFAPAHVLTLQVRATTVGGDAGAVQRFFDRALDAVRALPDVQAAGWTSQLPLTRDYEKYGVRIESLQARDTARDQSALRYAVTPGYFEAMGLRLQRGRWLDTRDHKGAPVAVMVSESFVRRRLAGRDPIGEHVHVGRTDLPWYTVVGVVADVKQASLAIDEADAVYIAIDQWSAPEPVLSLVVKTTAQNAANLTAAVRTAIWSVDREQPIVRVATLDALVAASAAERRFALTIFECFALAALALAATGIYGVLSGSVAERMREMGVRAALGASRGELLALVFGRGMAMACAGVTCGAVAAVGAGRAVATLLFGIAPLDGPTYAVAVLLLGVVAALACWAPAWRASRVDPAVMLRVD
jgi:putative ABC transport system permease protein